MIKRPSKYIKTPYVADIMCYIISATYVADIMCNDEEVLGHTASLGCCGLADVNATVLISLSSESKSKPKNQANMKCSYTVYLSVLRDRGNEQVIGIHPKLAETLTEASLIANMLTRLQNIRKYRRETAIYIKDKIDSRFDFT